MVKVQFGKWLLTADPQATREAHGRMSHGSPEECSCLHCRNFIVARNRVYPAEVLDLFNQLGIDPCRESEIYEIGPVKPGFRLYGGWFHLVGTIEAETAAIGPFDMEQSDDTPFRLYFAKARNLLPEGFGDNSVVQLEWIAHVPWLLGELPEPLISL